MPNHFTFNSFGKASFPRNHNNGALFTCEDMMFSRESSPGIGVYRIVNTAPFHFHKSLSKIVITTNTSRGVRSTVMRLIVDHVS